MVKITNTLFFVLCLVTSINGHTFDDLEIQISKPRVKSIRTESGYLVDCIDINKQPAFDHPLLKNHTLQRKPSFERNMNETSVKSSPNKLIYWLENIRCPKGTVPIRRITKVDLIRGKSVFNDHNLIQSIMHEAYTYHEPPPDDIIHGIKGTTSIYNPKVDKDQSSSGHLFVQDAFQKLIINGTNKIMVGWHVSPKLYNDDDSTYFYSAWTSDDFKSTGCYNMLCKGFVQTDRSYYLGSRIRKTSTYGGEMIEMSISLNKDRTTHNWWLTVADKTIGYFPAALFPNMVEPSGLGWGGSTLSPMGTSSPSMGSGHLPDKDFVHASYFRDIGIQVDDSGNYNQPSGDKYVDADADAASCYNVEYYGDQGEEFGYSLQFGGPGCN
ncbi:unnamed protein product [Trifolium pratense]|uniref:Uncharacterized protein n=1 Tax=Trifolium pratense TaxID=57577 RepID=A0ACB0IPI9_TRIPR|nr:unnamed protein product [Trifolium pratense]